MEKTATNDIVLTKKFKKFLHSIIEEHYNMTSQDNDTTGLNNSLNYLWYMYYKGVKAGTYRPFIFMAEMHLLKEMGYMTIEDIQNINNMIKSEDKDNFYIGYLSLESLRSKRIKEHGIFSQANKIYTDYISSYASKILNTT
jgi:hypothetical protein